MARTATQLFCRAALRDSGRAVGLPERGKLAPDQLHGQLAPAARPHLLVLQPPGEPERGQAAGFTRPAAAPAGAALGGGDHAGGEHQLVTGQLAQT